MIAAIPVEEPSLRFRISCPGSCSRRLRQFWDHFGTQGIRALDDEFVLRGDGNGDQCKMSEDSCFFNYVHGTSF